MYDRKNEANEFVADTIEEAKAAAVRFYDMDESELRISQAPAGEIYGLGGRAAIVAIPKNAKPPTPSRDGGEGGRGRDRGERRERGGRGDRGGRGRRDRGDRGDRGDRREGRAEAPAATPAEAGPLGKATRSGDVGRVGEFVAGVMERLRIGDLEISESSEGDMLVIQMGGDAVKNLHDADARATDALQLLANQAAKQGDDDAPRVVIEIDGESDDRESSLQELAARALKRARSTSRSIALDPMSPRDRRVIHLAVRDEEGVATMSIGSGRFRQVLVVPEGAREYEEALESSEGGAS